MMKIVIVVSCIIVLVLFFFFARVPVSLTTDEVSDAVSDAISESNISVDEDIVQKVVLKSVDILENRQSKRIRYLASAYLVIWLVFMLYVLRIIQQQKRLDQRLSQLEQDTPTSQDDE